MVGELVLDHRRRVDHSPAEALPERPHARRRCVLVGHQAYLGHGGGHTTWTCYTCDRTVYGPPLNTQCSSLDGPAVVRISNAAL